MNWLGATLRDLRYALRLFSKAPGFTAVALVTLALGIGATTTIFSVVKTILLDPLPYRDAGRLVALSQREPANPHSDRTPFLTVIDWCARSRLFRSFAYYGDASFILTSNGDPEVLRGERVSANFFDTLGVRMELGRAFLPEEEKNDWPSSVVILSHGVWVSRFGADPHIIGRVVDSRGRPVRIVGVLPADFYPPRMSNPGEIPQFFGPLGLDPADRSCRNCDSWRAVGRLLPGVTVAAARAELNAITRDLAREYPADFAQGASAGVEALQEHTTGPVRTPLWILLGAVAFLLLIACINVANLLLARATARAKEIALRAALGGGRGRLARQLLTESVLLAFAGGAAGVLLAWSATNAVAALAPREIPRVEEIHMDMPVLLFALAVSLATGVLFGLAPALRASRVNLNEAIKRAGERSGARGRRGLGDLLAMGEIACAFVLAAGTALLAASLLRLTHVDPGYDPHNILTLAVTSYGPRYDEPEKRVRYWKDVLARVGALPGIESVAMVSTVPLSQPERYELHIREHRLANEADAPVIDRTYISPDYFRVFRIPLRHGRWFTAADGSDAPPVAIISETCARSLFPHEDPLGMHVQAGPLDPRQPWAIIVGVVGDVYQHGMNAGPACNAYLPQAQNADFYYRLAARTAGEPMRWLPAVRQAFRDVDPMQPISHIQPMDDYVTKSLADRRFTLVLVSLFGALALVLAIIGVYGVISYTMSLRTHEIGIRMALGAEPGSIRRLVIAQGLLFAVLGLVAGGAIAAALARVAASALIGVSPVDPVVYSGVAVFLTVIAVLAAWLPARRAMRVDPMVSLRYQ
jgi:putative ABC transport system permease protein